MGQVAHFPFGDLAMKIELTNQQKQAIKQGRPVEVVDPATQLGYVILGREAYERSRTRRDPPIPPGIRRSQEAYWRDLPQLVKLKSRKRLWVAYHGDER